MTDQVPTKSPQQHAFVQAPVAPLDNDGVQVARLGTVLWAIATVVMWFNQASLAASGRGWWLWVGVAGVLLGVAMLIWALRRRKRAA